MPALGAHRLTRVWVHSPLLSAHQTRRSAPTHLAADGRWSSSGKDGRSTTGCAHPVAAVVSTRMDSQMIHVLETSRLLRQGGVALLAAASFLGATASIAGAASAPDQTQFSVTAGALAFSTTPALPALGAVTL